MASPSRILTWDSAAEAATSCRAPYFCTLDLFCPELVFVCFTTMDRREYYRKDGKRIIYLIDWISEETRKRRCVAKVAGERSGYDSTSE